MLNTILNSDLNAVTLMICLACSLVLGIMTAFVFSYKNKMTSSLSFALALLPVAMCMIVMMINGNLGIAISVAGSFTLVRFRSVAGTGKDIVAIFIVMVIGTILGMGYIGVAVLFFLLVAAAVLLLTTLHFGEKENEKMLKITIPENYDYTDLFDDIFEKHNVKYQMEKIRTSNMGSLIDITYRIELREKNVSKEMLDELRSRNANLAICISGVEENGDQL